MELDGQVDLLPLRFRMEQFEHLNRVRVRLHGPSAASKDVDSALAESTATVIKPTTLQLGKFSPRIRQNAVLLTLVARQSDV